MFTRLYTHRFFRHHNFYDREKYENVLKDPESKIGKKLNILIQTCVFLAVLIIVFETVGDWGTRFSSEFFLADVGVSLVFAGEYIYRFFRARKKVFFIVRPLNIIDFLSFVPFFLGLIFPALRGLEMLKVLRLLRTLRLFEVSSKSPIALGFMRTLKEYRYEYRAVYSIFFAILVIISTFVYYFENSVNPDFASILHSLWWGIVTMTTVGYGDMVPVTLVGKVFGVILILLGPALLAVISSITILVFMDVAESHRLAIFKTCAKCRTRNQDDANYCKNCGNEHFLSGKIEEAKESSFIGKLFKRKQK